VPVRCDRYPHLRVADARTARGLPPWVICGPLASQQPRRSGRAPARTPPDLAGCRACPRTLRSTAHVDAARLRRDQMAHRSSFPCAGHRRRLRQVFVLSRRRRFRRGGRRAVLLGQQLGPQLIRSQHATARLAGSRSATADPSTPPKNTETGIRTASPARDGARAADQRRASRSQGVRGSRTPETV